MDEGKKNRIEGLIILQEKIENSHYSFFRNLTTIATGFLGLLVGLKPSPIPNETAKYYFVITIALLGIGILFSVLTLYYEVASLRQEMVAKKKMLQEYVDQKLSEDAFQAEELPIPKIFLVFEIMTFACLSLSILSLIIYVFFLEFW